MTTLHMEVEAAKNSLQEIVDTDSEMNQMIASLISKVGNLQNTWQGNSAIEFSHEWGEIIRQCVQTVDQIRALGFRLDKEIAKWEKVSSKFE